MRNLSAISTPDTPDNPWRSLHVFNIYRLTLTGIIAVIFLATKPGTVVFGATNRELFGTTITIWIIVALVSGFASRFRKPGFHWLVTITILLDILFITALMYASGGVGSGLGTLMLVTTAASGILLSGQMSFAFAALATLALLLTHSYSILTGTIPSTRGYTQIGLLGVGLFSVTLLAYTLAQRIRESEALAAQRGIELAELSVVNDSIIQQMDIGVVVISENEQVLLSNDAAKNILSLNKTTEHKYLYEISSELSRNYKAWRALPKNNLLSFKPDDDTRIILCRFIRIKNSTAASTAVFLEDAEQREHQVQQAKLASLGRLTASIAHEIRNPLSAINHAGELLAESAQADEQDNRLIDIIRKQTLRLDTIVENILSLSRKEKIRPELINLGSWIEEFAQSLIIENRLSRKNIVVQCKEKEALTSFDNSHLEQILSNLVNNSIQHSKKNNNENFLIRISCTLDKDTSAINIDVTDNGPGISPENQKKIFEPFFTTESGGTGLGLFIAHELSRLNNARLSYIESSDTGAHFRLSVNAGGNELLLNNHG
jgi:two-component system sensor histidine kinase PilS (NtrC family)